MFAPDVEARPWEEQLASDDASYRRQLAVHFDALVVLSREAGRGRIADARVTGGLGQIARSR